jgi:DNA-binding CsgD family transcriptional regulator
MSQIRDQVKDRAVELRERGVRDQVKARAVELREQGCTYDEIANQLGISKSTVSRWMDPAIAQRSLDRARQWKDDNRSRNQARDHLYDRRKEVRGTCQECGNSMGVGVKRDGTCAHCRFEINLARDAEIERRWLAGESMKEIGNALGISKNHLGVEMDRMRKKGCNLPYRRRPKLIA